MPLIKNISKSFSGLEVLKSINIEIKNGSTVSVLGPSGCGKTTLLNIITGLLSQDGGTIEGINTNSISYIFQEPRLLDWKTVEDNIKIVLKDKYKNETVESKTKQILKDVELLDYKDYYPRKLSGGMQQRVALARAFIYPSNLLLMDEPFKSLDPELKMTMIKLFLKINKEMKRTTLFVTHDIKSAILLGDDIYIMSQKPTVIKHKLTQKKKFSIEDITTKEFIYMENKLYNLIL